MPLGRVWYRACVPAVVLLLAFAPAGNVAAASGGEPFGDIGFGMGPGWATPTNASPGLPGAAGGLVLDLTLSHSLSWGVDARFWFDSGDTAHTEIILVGPSMTWHPLGAGPRARVMGGVGYEHHIVEFAAETGDERLDGAGLGGTLGYEFRRGSIGLGPTVEYSRIWLGGGGATSFLDAAVALTWYFPPAP